MILPLGYSNGVSNKLLPKPASTRRYSWSFAGETTRASRPEMVAALKSSGTYICHSTDAGNSPPLAPSAYQDILRETVFAPSPMGRLNLECFRLYEALENGCIPIIEERPSLNYFNGLLGPHPLISVQRWTQARRVIADYSAEPARLDALQSQILSWWQSEKHAFKHRISDVLNDQSLVRKVTEPPLQPAYSTPFWQLRELYRHQSARGVVRRVKIQLLRAASGRSQKQLIQAD
jgi:hypothetical protein